MKSRSILGRVALARSVETTLYRQVYERVRASVLSGRLAAGTRLPSARSLSAQLGVARGTVEVAYRLLASEGYTVSRGAGGTVIALTLQGSEQGTPRRRSRARKLRVNGPDSQSSAGPPLFQPGLPAMDVFPRKLWARLAARVARSLSFHNYARQDAAGSRRLRDAIAGYLQIARGVECDGEQVFITAGYQGALGLIARVLIRNGEQVWVEDPGYFATRAALKWAQAKRVAIPVDGEGLNVEAGMRKAPAARLAIVTPTHQFPTGVTLTISRRLSLLQWAAASRAWVIEDDYDGEFHYRGRPLPALKSLDRQDRVLYCGTFSKVLFPGLRMGYVVVPPQLSDEFASACVCLQPAGGMLEQAVVCDFIEQGHFARHIGRMRQLYAERRAALVTAIERWCADSLHVDVQAGGMHLLTYLARGVEASTLQKRASAKGVAFMPLSQAAIEASMKPGLLLGFANVPVNEADSAARRLQEVVAATFLEDQ